MLLQVCYLLEVGVGLFQFVLKDRLPHLYFVLLQLYYICAVGVGFLNLNSRGVATSLKLRCYLVAACLKSVSISV